MNVSQIYLLYKVVVKGINNTDIITIWSKYKPSNYTI